MTQPDQPKPTGVRVTLHNSFDETVLKHGRTWEIDAGHLIVLGENYVQVATYAPGQWVAVAADLPDVPPTPEPPIVTTTIGAVRVAQKFGPCASCDGNPLDDHDHARVCGLGEGAFGPTALQPRACGCGCRV